MTETKTKLENEYTFYFRITDKKLQGGKTDYQDSVKKMAEFSTVEDFWKIFQHIKKPEGLKSGIEIQLFKNPIKPLWEDEGNKEGGRLSLRIKKEFSSLVWEELVLDMISGSFPKNVKDQLNGITISIRRDFNCLQIWFKNFKEPHIAELEKFFKVTLQIPEGIEIDTKPFLKNK